MAQSCPARVVFGSINKGNLGIRKPAHHVLQAFHVVRFQVGMHHVEVVVIAGIGLFEQRVEGYAGCQYEVVVKGEEYGYGCHGLRQIVF